jgi:wyosine [tRNA(Phe)-imidazoG37] synthetase (radical SAM superfamily)
VNAHAVSTELASALGLVHAGSLPKHSHFAALPPETLRPAHVAISGDGEPTLCPNFAEAVECVVHLRAAGLTPYFKLVLVTNATALDRPGVKAGLRLFTRSDEIWAKLDAGTEAGMDRVNRSSVSLERVLKNIGGLARQRPVVIQSMLSSSTACCRNVPNCAPTPGGSVNLRRTGPRSPSFRCTRRRAPFIRSAAAICRCACCRTSPAWCTR